MARNKLTEYWVASRGNLIPGDQVRFVEAEIDHPVIADVVAIAGRQVVLQMQSPPRRAPVKYDFSDLPGGTERRLWRNELVRSEVVAQNATT